MAAGSILINLLMLTGSFETDTKKAERALKRLQKEAVDTGKVMGAVLAAGAVTALYAFDKLVKGASDFQEIAEQVGTSAEDIASLAVAAGTAGVSMDTLAGNSMRLTKNLTGVDDESKAAGAAIKALGLSLDDFKKLDPVAQIDALTQAFASFEDGPQKAAVAMALWGKSGAEMLSIMKTLEDQGGRTVILTQQQIDQADAYADAQGKAAAELKLYAQAAMTQGAPAFLALTNAAGDFIKELIGVDKETGKLGQSTAVKDFADNAAKAIAFVVDAADGAIRVFSGIGLAIGAAAAAAAAVASGEFRAAKAIVSELKADLADLASRQFFSDRLAAQASAPGAAATAATGSRRRLNFTGAQPVGKGGAKAAKNEVDQVAQALRDLEEELALFDKSDAFKRAFKLEGMGATTLQIEAYRANLAKLEQLQTARSIEDAVTALERERDELGLTNEQLQIQKLLLMGASEGQIQYAKSVMGATTAAREQQAALDEGRRLYEDTRTPAEQLNIELTKYGELLQRGAIDWDTYARAVFNAQDRFDSATTKVAEEVDTFSKRFAENAQDLLGQGLFDMMSGNFDNIGKSFANMLNRMVAEAAAADLARHLFGGMVKGGSGEGLLGSFLSSIFSGFGGARASGGPVTSGKSYLVGERGPEMFVPRTSGTILPAGATQQIAGQRAISVTVNQSFAQGTSRSTIEQAAAASGRTVRGALARGTA